MNIRELIIQIASKDKNGEFTELENSFFILIGSMVISFVLILASMMLKMGVLKLVLMSATALTLYPLTKNALKFKKLMKGE